MTDREKFEAWYQSVGGSVNRTADEKYTTERARLAWWSWQAAIASQQPADDGWIEWGGDISVNEQPVSGMVEITYRNGVISKANAAVRFWGHEGIESDIIAYRVVKP